MRKSGRTRIGGVQRHGELEIPEDLPFQRREWVAERVAWAVMALLIAAALLGLFGTGPLSRMTAGDEGGPLWLEYERFARLLAPAVLTVHVGQGAARDGNIRVWVDRRYMQSVELQHVTPQADTTEAGPERLIFNFRQAEGKGAAVITFNMRPSRFGSLPGRIGLVEGPALQFQQFVYP